MISSNIRIDKENDKLNYKINPDQQILLPDRYLNLFKNKLKMSKEISGLLNVNLENEISRVIYNISKNASSAKKLDYEPQFEINFHTHPDKGKEVEPPSGTDIASFFIQSLENIYHTKDLIKRGKLIQKNRTRTNIRTRKNSNGKTRITRKSNKIKKRDLKNKNIKHLKKYDMIISPEGIYAIPYLDMNNKLIKNIYSQYELYKKSNDLTNKFNNMIAKKYGKLLDEFKSLKNSIIKEQQNRYQKILKEYKKGNIYKLEIIEEFLENKNNQKLFNLTSKILENREKLLNSKSFSKNDRKLINNHLKYNDIIIDFYNLIKSSYEKYITDFYNKYKISKDLTDKYTELLDVILPKKVMDNKNNYRDLLCKIDSEIQKISNQKVILKIEENKIKNINNNLNKINNEFQTDIKLFPWGRKVKLLIDVVSKIN